MLLPRWKVREELKGLTGQWRMLWTFYFIYIYLHILSIWYVDPFVDKVYKRLYERGGYDKLLLG